MLYDLTRQIVGDSADITCLMGAGIDPHIYQASAGDVAKMQSADIVIYNGLHLEGRLGEVFQSLERLGKTVICATDGISPASLIRDGDNAPPDPHIWFDVSLWKNAAAGLTRSLNIAKPGNSAVYLHNLECYLSKLNELEDYITERVNELEKSRRVLITAHDAFRYFGRAYGFEVLGLQGINTSSEAGTRDFTALAQIITDRKINAVFIETSVPPKNIDALISAVSSRGFEVSTGGLLYSDSLGESGSACDTYIAAFRANVDTIINALSEGY